MVQTALVQSNFFEWLYGPDFPRKITPEQMHDASLKQAANLPGLWSQTIAIPFQIVTIVLGLKLDLGASGALRWASGPTLPADSVLGYLGWLVLAPSSFVVFALVTALQRQTLKSIRCSIFRPSAGNLEWFIFAAQAAVMAPINDETCRGILLPWLLRPPAPGPADANEIWPGGEPFTRLLARRDGSLFPVQWTPLIDGVKLGNGAASSRILCTFFFVLLLMPFYLLLRLADSVQRWS